MFAFASTYSIAVLGRAIAGALSGNLGVLKSHLAEITDDTNRGKGFSYMSVAWASGTIIAPLLGGLLCKPAMKYPFLFSESSVFSKYPYALPNVVIGMFQIISATLCLFMMKETRVEKEQPLTTRTDDSTKQPPPRVSLARRSLAVEQRVPRNSDYEGISTHSQHGGSCGDTEGVLSIDGDDDDNKVSGSEDNNDGMEDGDVDDADIDVCLCICCCPKNFAPPDDHDAIASDLCGIESGRHTAFEDSSSNSAATTHSAFTIVDEDDDDDVDDKHKEQGNNMPSSPSLSILTTETDGTATMSSSSSSSLSPIVSRPHSDRILYRKGVVLTCSLYGSLHFSSPLLSPFSYHPLSPSLPPLH